MKIRIITNLIEGVFYPLGALAALNKNGYSANTVKRSKYGHGIPTFSAYEDGVGETLKEFLDKRWYKEGQV